MKPNNEKGGKKSMLKKSKRFLAGFLAFLLVVTMVPTDMLSVVYAEEESEAVETVEAETEVSENADADDDAEEVVEKNDDVKETTSIAGATITLSATEVEAGAAFPTVTKVEVGEEGSKTEVTSDNYEVAYKVDGAVKTSSDYANTETDVEVTVEITAIGVTYEGTATTTFTVKAKTETNKTSIAGATITLSATEVEAGAAFPTVTKVEVGEEGSKTEVTSDDYEIAYKVDGAVKTSSDYANTETDVEVTVEITAIGATYEGTATTTFTIKAKTVTPPAQKVTHKFDADNATINALDLKAEIPDGTTFKSTTTGDDNYLFTVVGKTTRGNDSNTAALELAAEATGSLQFTITGKAKVTIVAKSTSKSNTSELELRNASDTAVKEDKNTVEVVGTDGTTLTYSNVGAGTYKIVSSGTGGHSRGVRIYTVTVEEEEDKGPTVNLAGATVKLSVNDEELTDKGSHKWTTTYTGKSLKPSVVVSATVDDVETDINTYCDVAFTKDGSAASDFTKAGTITVKVTPKANTNLTGEITGTFEIEKAELKTKNHSITVDEKSYDTAEKNGEVTLADYITSLSDSDTFSYTLITDAEKGYAEGNVVDGTPTIDGDKLKYSLASTKPATVSETVLVVEVTSDNYEKAYFTVTFNIQEKAEITVTIANATHTYNKSVYGFAEKATVNADGLDADAIAALKEELIYTFTAAGETEAVTDEPVNAGTYTVTATLSENSAYTLSGAATATLTISPKTVKIKAADSTWEKALKAHPVSKLAGASDYAFIALTEGGTNVPRLETGDSMTTEPTIKYYKHDTQDEMADADWIALENDAVVDIVLSNADAGNNYTIEYEAGTLTAKVQLVDISLLTAEIPAAGAKFDASTYTETKDIKSNTIEQTYFLITADSANGVSIKKDSSAPYAIRTGGGGNQFKRNVAFKTTGAATLKMNVSSSNANEARTVVVAKLNADNCSVTEVQRIENVTEKAEKTVTLTDAGVYYIWSAGSNLYIYDIAVSYDGVVIPKQEYDIHVATNVANAEVTTGSKTAALEGDTVKLSEVATVTPANGYKLSSWTVTTATGTVNVTNDTADGYVFTMPAEEVTVTPVIVSEDTKEYTVTFKNGDATVATETVTTGSLELGKIIVPKEDGKEFKGWKAEDGTIYGSDDTLTVTGDMILTAEWTAAATYTITLMNGDTKFKEVTATAGMACDLMKDVPAETDGKVCVGWSEDPDATEAEYTVIENPSKDLTLYAVWKDKKDVKFTVTYYRDEKKTVVLDTVQVAAGEEITLPEPDARDGYTFNGWTVNGEAKNAGDKYTVNGDTIIIGRWTEKKVPETGMDVRVSDATYAGGVAVLPNDIRVYYKGTELTLGKDYTVKGKNNKNAGKATLTVTGIGNYKGLKKETAYQVLQRNISEVEAPSKMTLIKDAKVNPVILYNGKQLKLGKDFKLTEGNNIDAKGKYTGTVTAAEELKEDQTVKTPAETRTMKVEGTVNYTGTREITIKVVDKASAKQLAIEIDKNFTPVYGDGTDYDYLFSDKMKEDENGKETTEVEVARKIKVVDKKSKTTVLTEGDDFVVVYNNVAYDDEGNFAAGTVKFTVVGIGEYSGNVSKSFKISPKKLEGVEAGILGWDDAKDEEVFKTSGLELSYNPAGATFENSEEELLVRYSYKYTENGVEKTDYNYLEEGYDYTISYSGNKKVGVSAKAKINFIGDYKGTKALVVPFTITGATLNDWAEAYAADMTYTKPGKGYVSKPIVVASYDTDTILKASEYQVSYEWSSASDVTKDEATAKETRNWTADDKVKIELKDGDSYAIVRATIKPSAKSNFVLDTESQTVDGKEVETEVPLVVEYHVRKADTGALDLSKAKVEFYSDPACTKQIKAAQFCRAGIFTPAGNNAGNIGQYDDPDAAVYVKVIVNKAPVDASLYDVTWICNYDAGKATVIITGKGPSESGNASSGAETQADDETVTPPTTNDGPTPPSTAYAVGGKTVSVKINPLKTWIDPTPVTETVTNFLKELF